MSLTVKPMHLSHFCNSKNKNRPVKLEVGEEVFVSQKFPLFFYTGALKPVARNVMEGFLQCNTRNGFSLFPD